MILKFSFKNTAIFSYNYSRGLWLTKVHPGLYPTSSLSLSLSLSPVVPYRFKGIFLLGAMRTLGSLQSFRSSSACLPLNLLFRVMGEDGSITKKSKHHVVWYLGFSLFYYNFFFSNICRNLSNFSKRSRSFFLQNMR